MSLSHEQVELIVDAKASLGESPVWNVRADRLDWVDITAGRLHSTDVVTRSTSTISLPLPVGCVAPRASGGWIGCLADGFYAISEDGMTRRLVAVEADRPETRFNDGRCDPRGRLLAGTMAFDVRPRAGSLYRLDPDLTVHLMLAGVTISNGVDWSGDGRTMYYVDTATRRIDAFDYDVATGSIDRRRTFAEVAQTDGAPDGLVVDEAGGVWVALWQGWAIRRYSPGGELDRELRLPVSEVTSLCFGGPDLIDMYITTASVLLSNSVRARQPLAGGIFHARPGFRGRPPVLFAG